MHENISDIILSIHAQLQQGSLYLIYTYEVMDVIPNINQNLFLL